MPSSILIHFLNFRREVVINRTKFELKEAEARAHILEGLIIASDNIDDVIALIKKSKSPDEARKGLITKYKLSELQSKAILEMRLQKLTGLESNFFFQCGFNNKRYRFCHYYIKFNFEVHFTCLHEFVLEDD